MAEAAVEVLVDLVWEHPVTRPRLPVSWLSDEEKAVELRRVQARRAVDTAWEAELIMGLAGAAPGHRRSGAGDAGCPPARLGGG